MKFQLKLQPCNDSRPDARQMFFKAKFIFSDLKITPKTKYYPIYSIFHFESSFGWYFSFGNCWKALIGNFHRKIHVQWRQIIFDIEYIILLSRFLFTWSFGCNLNPIPRLLMEDIFLPSETPRLYTEPIFRQSKCRKKIKVIGGHVISLLDEFKTSKYLNLLRRASAEGGGGYSTLKPKTRILRENYVVLPI